MNHIKQIAAAFLIYPIMASLSIAAEDPIYTSFFSSKAAGGYDVTAYFSENRAVEGKEEFETEYMGATWLFASQENLDEFKSNPEKYAPQYGGYCAWAVAHGDLQKGDPNYWSLEDGKLYLNYDKEVMDRWVQNKEEFIDRGNAQWPGLLDQ